jgi:hypothetical protein
MSARNREQPRCLYFTGQCSGAFSGTDLGSGIVAGGCCTANIMDEDRMRLLTDHLFSDPSGPGKNKARSRGRMF